MAWALAFLAFASSLIQTSLIADDVFFPLYNFTATPVASRKVLLTPLSLEPATNQVAAYDPRLFTSDTNGTLTVTNMIQGLYRADIQAPPKLTSFYFYVPTNGTGGALVWASTIQRAVPQSVKTPQDYGYSAQASDARYLSRSGAGGAVIDGQPGANLPSLITSNAVLSGTVTLAGTTNLVLLNTNIHSVIPGSDTNYLNITLAGTTAARGAYKFSRNYTDPVQGIVSIWTNLTGTFGINYANDGLDWAFKLTNAAGQLYYSSITAQIPAQWVNVLGGELGASPGPFVNFGDTDVYRTELFHDGRIAGPALTSVLYVDYLTGNDYFAVRGRPDAAYRTVNAALAAALPGDCIEVSKGVYPATSAEIPFGVLIRGAGAGITVFTNSTGAASWKFGGAGTVLHDFSTLGLIIDLGGQNSGTLTNLSMWNLDIHSSADALVLEKWLAVSAIDCVFSSAYDAFADWTVNTNSGAVATFYNCHFIATNGAIVRSLALGAGTVRMYGGSLKARGVSPWSGIQFCVGEAVSTNGAAEFWGTSFDYGNTATNKAVYNPSGAPIKIHSPFLPFPPDAVAGVGPTYDTTGFLPETALSAGLTNNALSATYYLRDPNGVRWRTRDGQSWTNLNASQLSSGLIAFARIPTLLTNHLAVNAATNGQVLTFQSSLSGTQAAWTTLPAFASLSASNHFNSSLFLGGQLFGNNYFLDLNTGAICKASSPSVAIINFTNRQLLAADGSVTVDWESGELSAGGIPMVDWQSGGLLFPSTGTPFVDWANGYLKNDSDQVVFDVNSFNLLLERIYDSSSLIAIDVQNRQLKTGAGTILADWSGASFKSVVTTNSGLGTFVDFNNTALNSVLLQTNASFAFRGFQNMSPTAWGRCIMWVTNSGAATITMTPPPGCLTNGVWLVTNAGLTEVDWDYYGTRFTNGVSKPIK